MWYLPLLFFIEVAWFCVDLLKSKYFSDIAAHIVGSSFGKGSSGSCSSIQA